MCRIFKKVRNDILRPVYNKAFFVILLYSLQILLQSFQKVQKGPSKMMYSGKKGYHKTQKTVVSTKPLKKNPKYLPRNTNSRKTEAMYENKPKRALLAD